MTATAPTPTSRGRARVALMGVSAVMMTTGAVTAGLVAAPSAALALPTCDAGSVTTSSYTSNQAGTYDVPAGITRLAVVANGGAGGATADDGGIAPEGSGATVTSTVTVAPADTLTVDAGQRGTHGTGGQSGGAVSGGGSSQIDSVTGGGGGGASFVSDGATLLVAAAGGGGGGYGLGDSAGGSAASSTTAQPAGTISDGGAGSTPTASNPGGAGGGGGGGSATPGAGGAGGPGFGGSGSSGAGRTGGAGEAAAGGGGGGYAGGGGGGLGGFTGGGGAGSSYGIAAYTISPNGGDGSVSISYQVPNITSTSEVDVEVQQPMEPFTVCAQGVPTPTIQSVGGLPSGVSFTDNGDGTATIAGTPPAGSAASYPLTITASNGNGSNSVQDFTLNVGPDSSTTDLVANPEPSTAGESVMLTATVNGLVGGVDPTGTVDFTADGASISAGCDAVDVSTTSGVTTATCTIPSLDAADHALKASYGGDANYGTSFETIQDTVQQVTTSVGVTSAPNPSVYGQATTATATVLPADTAGAVQFSVGGTDVGPPVTVSGGIATSLPLTDAGSPLAPTDNTVTAAFTPTDTTDFTASSNTVDQVVGKDSTTTSVSVAPTTLTATVTADAPGAGAPSGSVTFEVDGVPVGDGTVSGGVATLAYTVPSGKTHNVAAVYGSDGNFTGSSASTARSDPSITATVTSAHPKSKYGWYRSAVTIHFSCVTHGAPLTAKCPAAVKLTKSAGGQSVTRTILATNGGAATAVVKRINIDTVKPTVTVKGVKNGGVYDGLPPLLVCSGHDALSGIATCQTNSGVHSGSTTGRLRFTVIATDKAGNVATLSGTYRVLPFFVEDVPFSHGAFDVKIGHDYTVGAVSKSQPRYYEAAPSLSAKSTPFVKGPLMTASGPWWTTTISVTSLMRHYSLWNIGAKSGKTLQVVRIRLTS
jgi:hypothetical protein